MAIGDSNDVTGRLQAGLPRGWFSGVTPILSALLAGFAAVLSNVYSLYAYAKNQTRILTATDGWLDLISADYFALTLPRNVGEVDASFRLRILANLFLPRVSRPAMIKVLTVLTGRVPVIFVPINPADTGAMGVKTSSAYCGVARDGSMAMPFTAFIQAYRPAVTGQGIAGAAYCNAASLSAMRTTASQSYTASLATYESTISDSAILAAINATEPCASVMGVLITN
jgi:hypothetical protein